MKKKYTAPVITIEHYELTQSIAACVKKINLLDSACVLSDPDSTNQMRDFAAIGWFSAGSCLEAANGMDDADGICYHTNMNNAFTS